MKEYIGKYRVFFRGADPIIATADSQYDKEMSNNPQFRCLFRGGGISFWEPTTLSADPKTGEDFAPMPKQVEKLINKIKELES